MKRALPAGAAATVLLLAMIAPPATAARPVIVEPAACPCGSAKVCTGKRGGRYCIGPSGAKRYVR